MMKFCVFRLNTDTELAVMCTAIENGGTDEWEFLADVLGGGQTRQRELSALACTRSATQMQR